MDEHHLTVSRTARFYTLGELDGDPRDVWIACHGFAQLAGRFIRHLTPIEDPSRLIIAPEALNRFYFDPVFGAHGPDSKVGATWMTREDRLREIADYVGYLDSLHATVFSRLDRRRVTLRVLGFSQGVATVTRWVGCGQVQPDHLILWSGALPPDLDSEARQLREVPRISVVIGERDEAAGRVIDAERARFERFGLRYELVRFDGGHELHAETLRRLAG
jgi:predicted esterase